MKRSFSLPREQTTLIRYNAYKKLPFAFYGNGSCVIVYRQMMLFCGLVFGLMFGDDLRGDVSGNLFIACKFHFK